jgi:DNA-binding transcriptional ArsR family regulator
VDAVFAALAHPTRRALLEHLRNAGDTAVSILAAPLAMTLTGAKKHIAVLEDAGLVRTRKIGRTRHVHLVAAALAEAEAFLGAYRDVALERFDVRASFIDLSDMDVT